MPCRSWLGHHSLRSIGREGRIMFTWPMTAAAGLYLVLVFAAGTLDAVEIKLLSANGAKLIVADLVAEFERKTNDKATISY